MRLEDQLVDAVKSNVKVPQVGDQHTKMIWILGRNAATKVIRNHIRYKITEPLPWLAIAPQNIKDTLQPEQVKSWLDGYNAAVNFVDQEMWRVVAKIKTGTVK